MAIKTLYRDYFQKSRIFLYPVLEIERGSSITPIQTYVSWKDKVSYKDKKLICVYHLRDDKDYKLFEKSRLLNNKYFEQYIEDGDGKVMYIFNFAHLNDDWNHFLCGRYSKMSDKTKNLIKSYFRNNRENYVYIESFLHPEKYYTLYADLLGVQEKVLKEVIELTDAPVLNKETLIFEMKEIEFNKPKI